MMATPSHTEMQKYLAQSKLWDFFKQLVIYNVWWMNLRLDWNPLFRYTVSIVVKLHSFIETAMFDSVFMVCAIVS